MTNATEQRVERLPVGAGWIPDSFEAGFLRQRDWRLWEVLSFYFGGLGTGLYVISALLDSRASGDAPRGTIVGMILGFLLVIVAKNGSHLMASTHPSKALRSMSKPGSSWISRGAVAIFIFGVFGALDIVVRLGWIPGDGETIGWIFAIIALASAFVVMVYIGFVMAEARTIALWHTPLLPVMYLAFSLVLGSALATGIFNLAGIEYDTALLRIILLVTIPVTVFLMLAHLSFLGFSNEAARLSMQMLTKGEVAASYIGGVLVVGLVAPLILTAAAYGADGAARWVSVISAVLMVIGGYLFYSSMFRAAVFSPVVQPGARSVVVVP